MNLTQFLALLRAASTPEARTQVYNDLTSAQRSQLATLTFDRASELAGLENRTDDQMSEMLLLTEAAEVLTRAATAENEAIRRVQQLATVGASHGVTPVAPQSAAIRTDPEPQHVATGIIRDINRGFDFGRPEARSIVGDLQAYNITDRQIERLGSPEYRVDFMRWIRSCAANPYGDAVAHRALNEITIDGGAAVVPLDFIADVIQRRAATKRVSSMVRRYTTSRDELSVPKFLGGTSTQISDLVVQWPGAEGTVTEDTSLQAWGNVNIKVHRGGVLIVADRAWLEDAAFDAENWIVEQIADMYNAVLDALVVSGSGNGRPYGLTTRTGTTTPAANLITAVNIGDPVDPTGLMNIIGNLDAQYSENAEWLWRRTAFYTQVLSLRDSVGGFIFGTNNTTTGGAQSRIDSQLLGYGVTHSDHMAAVGAGNKIAFFGDFRQGYALVERVTLQIEPHVDPAIQKKDQRAWYVRFRVGGDVTAEWALRCGLNTDV